MPDDHAVARDPAAESPPRPSRQDLVVPPRQANWGVMAGALVSGVAGFGLVLFLGIGRRPPAPVEATAAAEVVVEQEPAGAEPALLPPPPGRWATGAATAEPPATEPIGGRYRTRPVSHDEPPADPGREPAAEATAVVPSPRPLSRFSSADLPPPPAGTPAAPSIEEPASVEGASPADDELPGDDLPAARDEPPADLPVVPEPEPAILTELPAAPLSPPASPEVSAATRDEDPPAESSGERAVPLDDGGHAPAVDSHEPATTEPAVSEPTATEPGVPEPGVPEPAPPVPAESEPALVEPPGPDQDPAPEVPSPAVISPPEPAAPTVVGTPAPAVLPTADFGRQSPVAEPAGVAAAAIPPFAAAPAIGKAAPTITAEPAAPPVVVAPLDLGLAGDGVPGPLQLEGLQTPQLAVEKRGPKEIQVGKPARYEILVRNVGSATAHEVTLRDSVPRGTSLIATTPPASPAAEADAREGDLIWSLGVLPPGGEVRVLMELMPEEEGEIGSVASVSFRADATLRSRATKPALVIDCPEPQPVRIGGDVKAAITISNPGSGTATGVVLEAFLPETVSHRAGAELEFDVGQLRPGDSKTIELVLGTRLPGSQPARFIARADGGLEVDRALPLPVTAPTLELAIDMPARRFLQRPATCAIAMANTGTASARAVELAAQLPAGMKFVRANNAGWHDERTNRVLWNLEELPAGETGTVEMVVMPVQAGEQRITAAARSTDGPSDQVAHACQVEGLAALAFQVADSEDPIEVGGVTEYVVRVANEGTKAATGVRLAATLLGDLEPVEAEGPGRHRVENLAIEFEPLAKLGPGEEVVYRIRARGQRAGSQRVQVQLLSEDTPTPITKEELTSVYDDR